MISSFLIDPEIFDPKYCKDSDYVDKIYFILECIEEYGILVIDSTEYFLHKIENFIDCLIPKYQNKLNEIISGFRISLQSGDRKIIFKCPNDIFKLDSEDDINLKKIIKIKKELNIDIVLLNEYGPLDRKSVV